MCASVGAVCVRAASAFQRGNGTQIVTAHERGACGRGMGTGQVFNPRARGRSVRAYGISVPACAAPSSRRRLRRRDGARKEEDWSPCAGHVFSVRCLAHAERTWMPRGVWALSL